MRFAAVVAAATVVVGCGGAESRHVPPDLEAALPLRESLNQLCPAASTPPRTERRLLREAETLIRAARRAPDDLVTYTFTYEDAPSETREITLRELVEEQTSGPRCMPRELWERLRAAPG